MAALVLTANLCSYGHQTKSNQTKLDQMVPTAAFMLLVCWFLAIRKSVSVNKRMIFNTASLRTRLHLI
jgi:hypothetical protein